MNIFGEVKQRLTVDEVARFYGYQPNRAGFICCPFHKDKTASLKIYTGNRGWHCFGCGKGGSVIDFVSELYGIDPIVAVRRLNEDFHLALPVDRPPTQTERTEAQRRRELTKIWGDFEDWRKNTIDRLNAVFRIAHLLQPNCWEELTDTEALALKEQAHVEYLAEILEHGTMEQKIAVFREREGIERICGKILSGMPRKCEVA